jgi:hypothetical protein
MQAFFRRQLSGGLVRGRDPLITPEGTERSEVETARAADALQSQNLRTLFQEASPEDLAAFRSVLLEGRSSGAQASGPPSAASVLLQSRATASLRELVVELPDAERNTLNVRQLFGVRYSGALTVPEMGATLVRAGGKTVTMRQAALDWIDQEPQFQPGGRERFEAELREGQMTFHALTTEHTGELQAFCVRTPMEHGWEYLDWQMTKPGGLPLSSALLLLDTGKSDARHCADCGMHTIVPVVEYGGGIGVSATPPVYPKPYEEIDCLNAEELLACPIKSGRDEEPVARAKAEAMKAPGKPVDFTCGGVAYRGVVVDVKDFFTEIRRIHEEGFVVLRCSRTKSTGRFIAYGADPRSPEHKRDFDASLRQLRADQSRVYGH